MSKHRNAENQSAQSYERQLRFGSMLRKLLPSGSRRWITPIVMLLLLLGIWRHGVRRFPLRYDPLYWGAVFPLGMYAACTWQMDKAMQFGFLNLLPRLFFAVALLAWLLAFVGMLRSVARQLRAP